MTSVVPMASNDKASSLEKGEVFTKSDDDRATVSTGTTIAEGSYSIVRSG